MLTLEKNDTQLILDKDGDGVPQIRIELRWDENTNPKIEKPFDLDVSLMFLKNDRFVFTLPNIVFYNNICNVVGGKASEVLKGKTPEEIQQIVKDYKARGSYCMTLGDEQTGAKKGADETILFELTKTPSDVNRILIPVTIHEAVKRGHLLGDVTGARIDIFNDATGEHLLEYKLNEKFTYQTGVVIGEFYRDASGLSFRALADGFKDGLDTLFKQYA